ncbi:MAG TPA: hypothetical protein VEA59_00400 [Patescibacteria group bacterium]|nr:hypothetical protein [Patescibacteria group bacterium]
MNYTGVFHVASVCLNHGHLLTGSGDGVPTHFPFGGEFPDWVFVKTFLRMRVLGDTPVLDATFPEDPPEGAHVLILVTLMHWGNEHVVDTVSFEGFPDLESVEQRLLSAWQQAYETAGSPTGGRNEVPSLQRVKQKLEKPQVLDVLFRFARSGKPQFL